MKRVFLTIKHYLHRDYLGSIIAIVDEDGIIVERRQFDAWGNLAKLEQNGVLVTPDAGAMLLDRGYTGHEHLLGVGLINMNARLYDPKLHRFLQPDNYVQDPSNTQSYNRYGYCWNNPLVHSDPNGEWIWIVVGAVVGGVINWAVHGARFDMEGLKAFGIGAAAGAAAGLIGPAAFTAAGGGAAGAGGFFAGAIGGAVGSAVSQAILSFGNHFAFGDPLMSGKDFIKGIAFGALLGGTINGISALRNGNTFWKGVDVTPKVQPISLPKSAGFAKTGDTQIKSDVKIANTAQPSTAPTTQANTATSINKELGVVDVSKNPGFRIVDDEVITVTKDGVALPQGAKIPSELIENPSRSSSFGIMKDGKFIETLRIDPATPPGFKGPNQSHFHLNNGRHIFDQNKWPWW